MIQYLEKNNNSKFFNNKINFNNISEFNYLNFNNLLYNSFSFFNNNYIFLNFNNLENFNKNILKKIKLINKIKNKINFEIRNYLILLFIILFNK